MPVVYSVASADQVYPHWEDHPRVGKYDSAVVIKGGAAVQKAKGFITPRGVATTVSEDDLAFLLTQHAFNAGVDKGFFVVEEKAKKASQERAEEVATQNMEEKDGGAQKTEADFTKSGKKPPKKATEG